MWVWVAPAEVGRRLPHRDPPEIEAAREASGDHPRAIGIVCAAMVMFVGIVVRQLHTLPESVRRVIAEERHRPGDERC